MSVASDFLKAIGGALFVVGLLGLSALGVHIALDPPTPDKDSTALRVILDSEPRTLNSRSSKSILLSLSNSQGSYMAEVPYFNFIRPPSITGVILNLRPGADLFVKPTRATGGQERDFVVAEVRAGNQVIFSAQNAEQARRAADMRMFQLLCGVISAGCLALLMHRIMWARYH